MPPTTEFGEMVSEASGIVRTVSVAVVGVPLAVAVIVTAVFVDTAVVVIVNLPVVAPARIVMLETAGLATAVLLLEIETTIPPVGAAALRVTVPVVLTPPVTGLLLNVILFTVSGFTVNPADWLELPRLAVMLPVVVVVTTLVVTLNV